MLSRVVDNQEQDGLVLCRGCGTAIPVEMGNLSFNEWWCGPCFRKGTALDPDRSSGVPHLERFPDCRYATSCKTCNDREMCLEPMVLDDAGDPAGLHVNEYRCKLESHPHFEQPLVGDVALQAARVAYAREHETIRHKIKRWFFGNV